MGLGAGACSAPLVALIEIGPGAGACVRRSSDGHSAAMPGTQTRRNPALSWRFRPLLSAPPETTHSSACSSDVEVKTAAGRSACSRITRTRRRWPPPPASGHITGHTSDFAVGSRDSGNENPPFPAGFSMELARARTGDSWVRSSRSPERESRRFQDLCDDARTAATSPATALALVLHYDNNSNC
jgi:hypothetical protein